MKGIVGVVVALVAIGAIINSGHSSKSSSESSPPKTAGGANIYLVASKSFCVPTGVDDAYTGDGHIEFFLAFKNSGKQLGTVDATPVRHYDDGNENESFNDAVSVDVAAGQTWLGHTTAMKYKAHEHEINSCGVIVDGRDEVPINVH